MARPVSPRGAPPAREAATPEPPRVLAVELHLLSGADTSGLASLASGLKDRPLSRRAVRRVIELLYTTGRFADVVALASEVPGGVKLVFELTPKREILSVSVVGNRVLTREQVLEASRLSVGAEYYPERLRSAVQGVERAYHLRGYDQARVAVEQTERGLGLGLVLLVEEGPPTRLVGLSVSGSPGLPMARIKEAIALPVEAALDRKALERGLERLRAVYRDEQFYRARVGEPALLPSPGGVVLALPISAGPRYTFHFHGNRSFPDTILRAVLRYDGSETLDRSVISRMAWRLKSFYQSRGFRDVRVVPHEVRRPDAARAILAFNVDEGRPLYVEELLFEGNQALGTAELRRMVEEQIRSREPVVQGELTMMGDPLHVEGRAPRGGRVEAPQPEPATVLLDDAYREAAAAITAAYRERGFLKAEVRLRTVEIDVARGTARVRFEIFEGPRAIVREVSFSGAPAGFEPREELDQRAAMPLSAPAVERSREELLRALRKKGHLFAKVEARFELSEDGTIAKVDYGIDSGPAVTVGQVIVQGAVRTEQDVVLANLRLRPGVALDPDALFESQRELMLLGIFRQVVVRMLSPDVEEPVKDVVVELKERPRLFGEIGGGYSNVDGLRAFGDVVYPNVGGQGLNFSLRGRVSLVDAALQPVDPNFSGFGGRANIALQQPRFYSLLPLEVGARLDAIAERVFRPGYLFERLAGVAGLDYTGARWLSLALQYEIEGDHVDISVARPDSTTVADQERLRFDPGTYVLQTLRSTATLDFRDDPANPSRGLFLSATGELTGDLHGEQEDRTLKIHTFKLAGNLTLYLPLAPRVVLALSARGGRFFFPSDARRTIAPKRFFLGGTATMRGFREDGMIAADRREDLAREVEECRLLANWMGCTQDARALMGGLELASEGGELFTLGKAELRFPAFRAFDLGIFAEAGNLWLKTNRFDALDLRYVAGAGIRYVTPIGPLAFDLGFNLLPDLRVNEQAFNVNFSIGLF